MRGKKGFGFYLPETDRLVHNTKETRILTLLRRETTATEVLFHHRMPTSTENVRNAAHPFSTKANDDAFEYRYMLVHNGVIRNPQTLKFEHEKLGINYVSKQEKGSFNDSEALLYDVALYLEGKQEKLTAEGTIAFIILQKTKDDKPVALHFARNLGNPLKINRKKGKFLRLASQGKGADVEAHTLYTFDYATNEISKKYCYVPTSVYAPARSTVPAATTTPRKVYASSPAPDNRFVHYETGLTDPAPNLIGLAGHSYRNGFYDRYGKWFYWGDATPDKITDTIEYAKERCRNLDENERVATERKTIGFDTRAINVAPKKQLLLPDTSTEVLDGIVQESLEAAADEQVARYVMEILALTKNNYDEAERLITAQLQKAQYRFQELEDELETDNDGTLEVDQDKFDELCELDDMMALLKSAVTVIEDVADDTKVAVIGKAAPTGRKIAVK